MRRAQLVKVAGLTLAALAIVAIAVLSVGLYRAEQQIDSLTSQMTDDQAAPNLILSGLSGETPIGAQLAGEPAGGAGLAVVNESARVRFSSVAPTRRITGFATLQLSINNQGETTIRSNAKLEGKGLIENTLYEMWLEPTGMVLAGSPVLLQTGVAREECEERGEDCENILKLRSNLLPVTLFSVTTLEGLAVNIRQGQIDPASGVLPPVATGIVTAAILNR